MSLMSQSLVVSQESRVGVVGLGRMGANMARCLKDAGFPVVALFDIDAKRAADLGAELDAVACPTLKEVAMKSDVVITVVTDDKAMCHIYEQDADNLLMDEAGQGTLFVNCATVTPQVHVRVRELCDKAGAFVLEAPMASSIPQAREGKLYLMLGGDEAVYQAAMPLIEALSVSARYIGESGKAAELKALVNMVMNINTAALAEGLGLAEALGLDLTMVREVFSQTGANSRVLETDGECMQVRNNEAYFTAEHAAKDSGIALTLGLNKKLPMVLAQATKQQYDQVCDYGLGYVDKAGIAEITFLERLAENQEGSHKVTEKSIV